MYQPPTGQAYPQYAYPPHPQHEYGQGPPPGGVYATLPQQYPQQYPQQQPQPQLNLNQLPQPVPAPIPVYENAAPVYYSDIESNKQPLLGGDDALGASFNWQSQHLFASFPSKSQYSVTSSWITSPFLVFARSLW
eukprot:TRINITY_DN3100_c0_g1_i3.p1 TRINITY_DN3100_c0_g1~~TRINITY_DN3100_c0_g1_i3.p1  ORF type:complete len:135 (-),score=24.95 TRINITY_DN3100_c0_g1_i3:149-553(-)